MGQELDHQLSKDLATKQHNGKNKQLIMQSIVKHYKSFIAFKFLKF